MYSTINRMSVFPTLQLLASSLSPLTSLSPSLSSPPSLSCTHSFFLSQPKFVPVKVTAREMGLFPPWFSNSVCLFHPPRITERERKREREREIGRKRREGESKIKPWLNVEERGGGGGWGREHIWDTFSKCRERERENERREREKSDQVADVTDAIRCVNNGLIGTRDALSFIWLHLQPAYFLSSFSLFSWQGQTRRENSLAEKLEERGRGERSRTRREKVGKITSTNSGSREEGEKDESWWWR